MRRYGIGMGVCMICVAAVTQASAVNRYVSTNGTHDVVGGFTNWVGAATNIQAAVNVAEAGDTVWVTNGVYLLPGQISVTKGIVLRSLSGNPDDTVLMGGYPALTNRILFLNHADAVVEGFTLTNGAAPDDATFALGGGAKIEAGTLRRCTVIGCRSLADGNWRKGWAGGVYAAGANSLVTDCRIEGNTARLRGGGAYLENDAQLRNSVVIGNQAGLEAPDNAQTAGGVYLSGRSLAENCVIVSNTAHVQRGGGVCLVLGEARLVNSFVWGNTASAGAGVSCHNGSTTGFNELINCTVAGNIGHGIYVSFNSGKALWCENTIVHSNTGANVSRNMWNGGAEVFFHYSCIPGVHDLPGGEGNIDADPLFVDLNAGNARLMSGSPCINAGTNQTWMTAMKDLDGSPRIDRVYGKVDMGAYEYQYGGTTIMVR